MKRSRMLLLGIAVVTIAGAAWAFTPKATTALCFYVPNVSGTACVPVGKVNAGPNTVTGRLLNPNPGGICPSAPTQCNDQVDIEQE